MKPTLRRIAKKYNHIHVGNGGQPAGPGLVTYAIFSVASFYPLPSPSSWKEKNQSSLLKEIVKDYLGQPLAIYDA